MAGHFEQEESRGAETSESGEMLAALPPLQPSLSKIVWADALFGDGPTSQSLPSPIAQTLEPEPEPEEYEQAAAAQYEQPAAAEYAQAAAASDHSAEFDQELGSAIAEVEEPFEEIDPSAVEDLPDLESIPELQGMDPDDPINAAFDIMFGADGEQQMFDDAGAYDEPQTIDESLPISEPPTLEEENPFASNMFAEGEASSSNESLLPRPQPEQAEQADQPEALVAAFAPQETLEPSGPIQPEDYSFTDPDLALPPKQQPLDSFEPIQHMGPREPPDTLELDRPKELDRIPEPTPKAKTEAPAAKVEQTKPPPLPTKSAPRLQKRSAPTLAPKGDIVLGIDLGTTYSCAAIAGKGGAHVLASRWGTPTIPSVVTFLPDGRTLVGETALRHAATHPERTIIGWKRLLGRPFHSSVVQEVRSHFAYEVVEGERGDAAIQIDGRIIPLEDVAAAVLQEIRESAALQLDGRVNRAVITCPAHFNERQREAVRKAGELAGFYVERVLGEPTSAAMNFGIGKESKNRKVLVYDLGGGTFDVSLLKVDGDTFEVLATGADTFLGGLDFDACLGEVITEAFQAKENIDARTDPVAIARILEFAEKAKRELSQREAINVEIEHLVVQPYAARSLSVKIERKAIEEMWAPLVDHTINIVKSVLERANLTVKDIDDVVLVGGQSRTPLVQRKVEQLFDRALERTVNPDEAIALGASQFAESMDKTKSVVLIEALPVSIGVALPGGRMKKILERDTRLPAERTYHLHTTRDDQQRFEIILYQGDDEHVDRDDPLGIVELDHLPKGPKGSIGVLVTLRVNGECVLEVSARETKTGRTVGARLATKHTSQEIRRKLRLPPAPSPSDVHKRRATAHRPKGVWGWLTRIFAGNSA